MTALELVGAVFGAVALGVAVFALTLVGLAAAMRARPYDLLPPHASPPRRTPRDADGGQGGPSRAAVVSGAGRHPHRPRCTHHRQLPSYRKEHRNP